MTTMTILNTTTTIDEAKGFTLSKGTKSQTFKTYEEASKALHADGGVLTYYIKK